MEPNLPAKRIFSSLQCHMDWPKYAKKLGITKIGRDDGVLPRPLKKIQYAIVGDLYSEFYIDRKSLRIDFRLPFLRYGNVYYTK